MTSTRQSMAWNAHGTFKTRPLTYEIRKDKKRSRKGNYETGKMQSNPHHNKLQLIPVVGYFSLSPVPGPRSICITSLKESRKYKLKKQRWESNGKAHKGTDCYLEVAGCYYWWWRHWCYLRQCCQGTWSVSSPSLKAGRLASETTASWKVTEMHQPYY